MLACRWAHTHLSSRCLESALEVQMILIAQQISKEETHGISNLAYGEFEMNAVRGSAPLVLVQAEQLKKKQMQEN
jgi:hypothetical protein